MAGARHESFSHKYTTYAMVLPFYIILLQLGYNLNELNVRCILSYKIGRNVVSVMNNYCTTWKILFSRGELNWFLFFIRVYNRT